jgi:predicted RNA-binding Zn ribbon-like protein
VEPATALFIHFGENVTDTGDSPVVAEVFDAKLTLAWRGTITLGQGTRVSLPIAGPCIVRVWLPNGELITVQPDVVPGQLNDVPLYPEVRSPHEDFGWAVYVQANPIAASTGQIIGETGVRALPELFRGLAARRRFRIRAVYGGKRGRVTDAAGTISVESQAHAFQPEQLLTLDDEEPRRVRVRANSGQVWLCVDEPGNSHRRLWIALPTISGGEIELLLRRDPELGVVANVRTDPLADSMLGYLGQGDYAMARVLTEDMAVRAEQMLQAKTSNPILATIAAYALLRAGDFDRMHNWSLNLARWFEDLPDGPVIAGWHVLRTTGDVLEAGAHFRQAIERGVPLFSIGLRLLFELGEVIASAHSAELTEVEPRWLESLRRAESARQRWSTTTALNDVEPYW